MCLQIIESYLIEKQMYPLSKKLEESNENDDVKDFSRQLSLSKPR